MALRLNTPFESGSAPWGWQNYEYVQNNPNAMSLSTDHAREGTRSLKITMNATDSQAAGNNNKRVELTHNNNQANANQNLRWYGFSWYFPSATMPSDSKECVIIQWHDKAIPPQSCSTSPFLAIEAKNDRFRAMIRYSTTANYCINGGITLRTPIDLGPIIKDTWIDCVIYYRPSVSTSTDPNNSAAGRIMIWLYEQGTEIKQVLDFTGACFANGTYYPYLKWGVYKWLWNNTNTHVPSSLTFYGDAFRAAEESDSFNTVAPINSFNQPPLVNAGSPQSHAAATTSVTLSGSASDPGGSIASTVWTRVSGPNTPTITSASSLSTTVTGMVAGTYQFRLTATDNLGATSSATVLIRINSVPTIDLSGNTTAYLAGTTSINLVSSTTDPDGVITSRLWTQLDGPAAATITSPTSANTSVTGMQAGRYTFRLTITDNDGDIAIAELDVVIDAQTVILGRPRKRFVQL